MQLNFLAVSPIVIIFGILGGVMVFLDTYRHFPKMESEKRFGMSLANAIIATLLLLAVVYIAMDLIFKYAYP